MAIKELTSDSLEQKIREFAHKYNPVIYSFNNKKGSIPSQEECNKILSYIDNDGHSILNRATGTTPDIICELLKHPSAVPLFKQSRSIISNSTYDICEFLKERNEDVLEAYIKLISVCDKPLIEKKLNELFKLVTKVNSPSFSICLLNELEKNNLQSVKIKNENIVSPVSYKIIDDMQYVMCIQKHYKNDKLDYKIFASTQNKDIMTSVLLDMHDKDTLIEWIENLESGDGVIPIMINNLELTKEKVKLIIWRYETISLQQMVNSENKDSKEAKRRL